MSRLSSVRTGPRRVAAALCVALGLAGAVAPTTAAATAAPGSPRAVGDDVIAWVEVEDGAISGGPALNSGDHSNFSGTGSYTFRETGMTSTMTVTAPAAGTYPVWVRYAAGPLGADENVTRSMGLLTNGGARQVLSYPMTSFENWEAWRFVRADVTLTQGANTIAVSCDRSTDFCRLNFDAIQVGGTAPDPCPAVPPAAGYTRMFDGTFDSFDGWRKAGAGGFGRQTDCSIRSIRGKGAEWFTTQQAAPYTLRLDWKRNDANDDSSVYVGSSSRGGAEPVGGYAIGIGADTGAIVPTGGTAQPATASAVAAALRPVGQWNSYTVELTATQVKVLLNGTLVNTLTTATPIPASGFVGLENRGFLDTVDFKNIQVRAGVGPTTQEVQVLGTNDFHGRLLANGQEAGAAVLAGAVAQLRAAEPHTVFAAAGDLIGASTFESFIQDDEPTIDALNAAGLEVSAAGNHEFDQGYDDLVGRVADRADWEYVAANVRRKGDGTHALAASWTKDFGDVEVGFVGAVTEDLPSLVSPAGISDITVTDVVDEVNAEADALEADGVDVIVLLVHEGAATTSLAAATDTSAFGQIVTGVGANVDAIVSGHTHLAYNHSVPVPAWVAEGRAVTERPVVSAGQYGTNLNRLTFTVDTATGDVTATTQALLPLVTTPAYAADPDTAAVVAAAVTAADELGAQELGTVAAPFHRARLADGTTENRGGESTLGNLVAEVHRWATESAGSGGAQIAFMNPGGLRADLLGNPGGYPATLTYRQAALVQPFANTLVNMRLTGAQLATVLEEQWQRNADGTVPARPFLRLGTSAGFRYTYDPTRPRGARITGMWLDDEPVVATTGYSVTVNSFLAAGGDNFRGFAAGTARRDTGRADLAAMVDYLAAHRPVAPDLTQHAVGVSHPGGAPTSHVAGGSFDVDLTSLAFSAATDQRDTAVDVALDGEPLGSYPVDNTLGTAVDDESGRAAVRATIPAGTPAGPATITVIGNVTGTTVELPLTITRPAPPIRTDSATTVSAPLSVPVARGQARVSVAVAAPGSTPTGRVELWVAGARVATVALRDGRASATVGPFATAGTKSVVARYLGSDATEPSTSAVTRLVIERATTTVTARVQPARVVARTTRPVLAIAVTAPGVEPGGKVTVRVAGRTHTGTVRHGTVRVRLAAFARAGSYRAVVTYAGDAVTKVARTSVRVRVVTPRR